MDILFTLLVWAGIVVLIAHGLRLTQLHRDAGAAASEAVVAKQPERVLVGAAPPR